MKLFYREYGEGKPIIIAHGLFAMSDSWITVAKQLSQNNKVYVLDLRNHGQSAHSDVHTYEAMSNDFLEFMTDFNIEKATFIGHSMGGKAVMQFANSYPERIEKMIIVDVSPRAYVHDEEFVKKTINHKKLLEVLKDVNLNDFKNRKEIINYFSEYFNDIFILQLIQKNIKKNSLGEFKWKINVEALYLNLNEIVKKVKLTEDIKNVKTMFVFGGESPYYKPKDKVIISKYFIDVKFEIIESGKHLLHIDNEKEFIDCISYYL